MPPKKKKVASAGRSATPGKVYALDDLSPSVKELGSSNSSTPSSSYCAGKLDVPQWDPSEKVSPGRTARRSSSLRKMRSWIRKDRWLDLLSISLTSFMGCVTLGHDVAWYNILIGSYITTFGGGIFMNTLMSAFEGKIPTFPFSKDDWMHPILWIFGFFSFYFGFTASELKSFTGTEFYTFLIAVNYAILVSVGSHFCFAIRTEHWFLAPFLVYIYVHGGGDMRDLFYKDTPGITADKFTFYHDWQLVTVMQIATLLAGFSETHYSGKSKATLFIAFCIYAGYLKYDALVALGQSVYTIPIRGVRPKLKMEM